MARSPEPDPAGVIVAVLERMLSDLETSGLRPVSEYQALFPGFDGAIAAEYGRLVTDRPAGESGAGGRESFETLFRRDRSEGRDRGLAEYLALFPGAEAAVAERFAVLEAAVSGRTRARGTAGRYGHYEVVGLLGRGGQGVVYLARDTRLSRNVALKVLPDLAQATEGALARFFREAQTASKLDHPAICTVYDSGSADGIPFIAMRLVEGKTLARRLEIARDRGAPLLEAESGPDGPGEAPAGRSGVGRGEISGVVRFIARVAEALETAHAAGVTHRDVKPANIMVTPEGSPVVLDFGLARHADADAPSLTRTGEVFGTPAYMSPEQLSADPARVDPRTDVYSLGVVAYECLTLRRPFESPTREGLFYAIQNADPVDPRRLNPALPRDLAAVLRAALERDPERRYPTARALRDDLVAVLEGRSVTVKPVGRASRFLRWARRRPAAAALLVVLVVGAPMVTGLAGFLWARLPDIRRGQEQVRRDRLEIAIENGFLDLADAQGAAAVAKFEDVIREDPDSAEAAGGIVLTRLREKRPRLALAALDRFASMVARRPGLRRMRAIALRAAKDTSAADAVEATLGGVTDALDHFLIGATESGVVEGGDRAASERSRDHLLAAVLASPRSLYYGALGLAAMQCGDAKLSRMCADVLVERWPGRWGPVFYAGCALQASDPDRALAIFAEAARLDPKQGHPHNQRGRILALRGQLAEAVLEFRAAAALDPSSSAYQHNLGRTEAELRRIPEAVAHLERAVAIRPDDAESWLDLGLVRSTQNDARGALPYLLRARDLDPASGPVRGNIAACLLSIGKVPEALAEIQEALRIDARLVFNRFMLGRILEQLGRCDEAVLAYREVVSANPCDGMARRGLARCLVNLGRGREALETMESRPTAAGPASDPLDETVVAAAKQAADIERRLEAVAAGTEAPESPAQRADLAGLALARKEGARAAGLYERAFRDDASLAKTRRPPHRLNAARAALLASRDSAAESRSGGADSARWRERALAWFGEEIASWKAMLDASRIDEDALQKVFDEWDRDPLVKAYFDGSALEGLPAGERRSWEDLARRRKDLVE